MAEGLPPVSLDVNGNGAPVVIVGEARVNNAQELLAAAPMLTNDEWVRAYAKIVNHIAHGYKYDLILDPAAFETQYMKEYEAEDPNETPVPGLVRLHNYGIPEFGEITAPAFDGETLVFYVRETYLGIPYKATMGADFKPVYYPVTLNLEGDEDDADEG